MIPINYHHLYYFWITAKAGRIGAASRELYLAQPTLSLQLQQLERTLRKKLLVRSRKGVKLTPEGRIAFDYCERIFSQGAELISALQPGQALTPASLRLGVTGPISHHIVLQILDHTYGINRQVRVSILGGPFNSLREQLENHRLDLVVSSADFSSQMGVEFRSRLAGSIPIYFVAIPRLKAQVARFPMDLSKIPILLMAPDNPVRKDVDLLLCRHKTSVSVGTETEDSELIRFLALRGHGVAAMDALTIRDDLKLGRLMRLHRKDVDIKQNIWFICGRHPKPNPVLRRIIQSLMGKFTIQV
ncbi:MAG: LysR family transcriptional regulator [Elusimicrobiota bacterium]|nr:LysR family transcriptional regulator [Elusimicrobiota bacterium]